MVRRSVMATWRQPAKGSQARTPWTSRLCGQWRSGICQQLGGGLVEAHHWPVWVVGFGVQIQDLLHSRHELPAYLGDAPLLLAPRFEDVFFRCRRTVSWDKDSTTPKSTIRRRFQCTPLPRPAIDGTVGEHYPVVYGPANEVVNKTAAFVKFAKGQPEYLHFDPLAPVYGH